MEDFKTYEILPEFKEECYGKKCNVEKLKKITADINFCFIDEQKNFCQLCYNLNELRNLFYSDECYYHAFETKDKRYPFEAYVNEFFGLDLRYVEKCIAIYKKFMFLQVVGDVADLNVRFVDCFQNFNKSKLFELLPVAIEQLKNDIRIGVLSSEMSARQIREYVKNLKGGKKKENVVLEDADKTLDEQEAELPSAFDPQHEYDFDFYKSKTKGDLVGYCVDFQRLVQKLLKKKK